ncbi:MAG: NADH-quinone oxidoreductase subunit C [Calditrichia bacterium]|nr:NADH-quinone oxidoreductase subunit C [Calditrichia bacterium]
MTEKEIFDSLKEKFNDDIMEIIEEVIQPFIIVKAAAVEKISTFLRDEEKFQFDWLNNLSGVHYPAKVVPEESEEKPIDEIEVVYHLYSMKHRHNIILKTRVPVSSPKVPSVAMVWRTADWHERETYDLFGIEFSDHPDLRRILLPDDWEGFPLRRDYITPEYYDGMKIPYPEEDGDLKDE